MCVLLRAQASALRRALPPLPTRPDPTLRSGAGAGPGAEHGGRGALPSCPALISGHRDLDAPPARGMGGAGAGSAPRGCPGGWSQARRRRLPVRDGERESRSRSPRGRPRHGPLAVPAPGHVSAGSRPPLPLPYHPGPRTAPHSRRPARPWLRERLGRAVSIYPPPPRPRCPGPCPCRRAGLGGDRGRPAGPGWGRRP